jgi:hypothetical protein
MRIGLLTIAVALAASFGLSSSALPSTARDDREPAPIRGAPLPDETGLRLVVADNPPFVLDIDTGRATPVPGVRPQSRGTVRVVGVGGRAAVVDASAVYRHANFYAVRGRAARVSELGTGADVAPAPDGRSVWVKSFANARRCTLRQLGLDGQAIRAPRAFPCASTLYPAGSLGLVVNRTRVFDPRTGHTLLRTRWGVLAGAGRTLVLAGPTKTLIVLDTTSGAQRRMPWPSTLIGLDYPAVDPLGRYVALAFGSPGHTNQVLDVWVLDSKTKALTQLPGMPAFVALKRTSLAWTDDGRLVLLGHSSGRDVVAVWRPGDKRLAVKTIDLPERDGSSDSFAVLR